MQEREAALLKENANLARLDGIRKAKHQQQEVQLRNNRAEFNRNRVAKNLLNLFGQNDNQ